MKSHGTLFSGPMVRALLAGIKTQTRRIVTARNSLLDGAPVTKAWLPIWERLDWSQAYVDAGPSPAGNEGQYWHVPEVSQYPGDDILWHRIYPRIRPGDQLWVKETFRLSVPAHEGQTGYPVFRADFSNEPAMGGWTPSILMPRWASRLVLAVPAVRTERLQDISEADAIAEGVEPYVPNVTGMLRGREQEMPSEAYRTLWESINGRDSWAANPPVWIYELKRKVSP